MSLAVCRENIASVNPFSSNSNLTPLQTQVLSPALTRVLTLVLSAAFMLLGVSPVMAGGPGLPFTEDFSTTNHLRIKP